mmetsp:Transcript_16391/g.27464  ORF Transcript_16391/g.27464 Transcript_16391/m.27464 type:complete len:97 (-) Transcript_16391:213-503(-)
MGWLQYGSVNLHCKAAFDRFRATQQERRRVSNRNPKQTYLLQNLLRVNSRTMMVVTVRPTDLTFDESLSTLQFATSVCNVNVGAGRKQSNATQEWW